MYKKFSRKTPFKKGENAKVKNATKVVYNGINFDSKLEAYFYKYSRECGFNFEYEKFKTILLEGPRLEGYLYQPDKLHNLVLDTTKIKNITYSPDFHLFLDRLGEKVLVVVECKGLATDSYKIKKKIFLTQMNKKYGQNFYFLEPHNQQQVRQCIELIKTI